MVVKNIYIARHGFTAAWLPEDEQPNSRTGAPRDLPLTDHGLNQAKDLAHYLLSIDMQPDLIISAPAYACLETCKPVASLLDVPVFVERGLGEWFDPGTTDIPTPVDFEILNSLFPGLLKEEWGNGTTVEPSSSGETQEVLFVRCSMVIAQLLARVEAVYPDVENVLIVTHAPVKISLGLNLLQLSGCESPLDEDGTVLQADVCSLDKYQSAKIRDEEEDEDEEDITQMGTRVSVKPVTASVPWIMTMLNNTEFLRDGEERRWSFASTSPNPETAPDGTAAEEETETVYISVDLSNGSYKEKLEIERNAIFQYSGLDQEHPFIRIGDKLYEGNWGKLLGTELAFPDAATINKRSDAAEDSTAGDATPKEGDAEVSETAGKTRKHESKHAEKIYRIVDRLTLRGLQPM